MKSDIQEAEVNITLNKKEPMRVAVYCRVSTGEKSQQTSFETQKSYYTKLIAERTDWILAGLYADEAISGTSRAHRQAFNTMMADALAGKIDYILTKSISRFARNTLDALECVRQLRACQPPVGVLFEKENIDTLNAAGELILTILSALAQEESRSISENIRWAIRRKFQKGEPMVDLNRMLGYRKGPDGRWEIHPDQAAIVRRIFSRFLSGASANAIAKELNQEGISTVMGKLWRADSVLYILRNEKYMGDCENQKYITKSFLTHETAENRGQQSSYYIRNHHEAIVSRDEWEQVQQLLDARCPPKNRQTKRTGCNASVFSILVCGKCGNPLRRMGYHRKAVGYQDERCAAANGLDPGNFREEYTCYLPMWRCSCKESALSERVLEQSFMELMYHLKQEPTWLEERFSGLSERWEDWRMLQENYQLFQQCLAQLPQPSAGLPVLHTFRPGLLRAFCKKGIVLGDIIQYETNFAVSLPTPGNSRPITDLANRQTMDGALVTTLWEITGRKPKYTRKKLE